MREQRCHVEHLRQRVGADHTGLQEERVDRDVRCGDERARMRPRRARACGGASALHRDDGLHARHATCDPRKLARISERLEVEQNHLRPLVLLPESQQIVARYISLVADRHEARDAEAEHPGVVDDREPESAALRHEGHAPGGRRRWREGDVEPHRGLRVDHPHAIGPDEPHPSLANDAHEGVLQLAPRGARLREAGGDHDERLHALSRARARNLEHCGRRYDDHGEIHRTRNILHRRVGDDTLHLRRVRIHGIDRTVELVAQQIVKDLGADRAAAARGSDHRDGVRAKERYHPLHGRGPFVVERGRGHASSERFGMRVVIGGMIVRRLVDGTVPRDRLADVRGERDHRGRARASERCDIIATPNCVESHRHRAGGRAMRWQRARHDDSIGGFSSVRRRATVAGPAMASSFLAYLHFIGACDAKVRHRA